MNTNIYLNNKYTETYWKIIHRAQNRPKPEEYTENHHTDPKSITKHLKLPKSKTVPLTFKEHWVVHHLLMKAVKPGILRSKMYYAFSRIGQQTGGRVINARMYERIKTANVGLCSGKNSISFGRIPWNKPVQKTKKITYEVPITPVKVKIKNEYKFNESAREKMRKAKIGVYDGVNNPMYDTKRPESVKQKIAEKNSRIYQITFPDSHQEIIKNLANFCNVNNLCLANMRDIVAGRRKQHKGFKCSKITPNEVP
jgi:hypothetical protein